MAKKPLNEKYAMAKEAGLSFAVSTDKNAVRFYFSGYNEKMELLIDSYLKDFKRVQNIFDEAYFNVLKDEMINNTKKYLKMGYFTIADYVLDANESHSFEELEVLAQVNYEHLEKFIEKCFKNLKIQILIQGNFLKDQALGVTKTILDHFEADPVQDVSL